MTHENWNYTLAIVVGALILGFVGQCARDDMRRADEARAECIRVGGVWLASSGACAK